MQQEQVTALDSPLTVGELHKALQGMPSNKAPGPDGFPAEFYKIFWTTLGPTFHKMVLEIKGKGKIPKNMNSAT